MAFLKDHPDKFWRYQANKKNPVEKIVINERVFSDLKKKRNFSAFQLYFQSVYGEKYDYECRASSSLVTADFNSYQGVLSMLLNLKTKSLVVLDRTLNIFFDGTQSRVHVF